MQEGTGLGNIKGGNKANGLMLCCPTSHGSCWTSERVWLAERVWRRRRERYYYAANLPYDRYGGGSVTVWGGVTTNVRIDLHVCQGRVSVVYYRVSIIEPVVVPFAAVHGNSFRFQDANARAHRAHVGLNHLQTRGIQSLPWPAMSPNLFPIEHVWDILGRRVQGHVPAPRNLQEE